MNLDNVLKELYEKYSGTINDAFLEDCLSLGVIEYSKIGGLLICFFKVGKLEISVDLNYLVIGEIPDVYQAGRELLKAKIKNAIISYVQIVTTK